LLKNATDQLRPGGFFIITTPSYDFITKKLKEQPPDIFQFGNEAYTITFKPETDKNNFPPFGAIYEFSLVDGTVEKCPEYLVNINILSNIAEQYGLELIYNKNFQDIYTENCKDREYEKLLRKMKCLKDDGTINTYEWEAFGIYQAIIYRKKGQVPKTQSGFHVPRPHSISTKDIITIV